MSPPRKRIVTDAMIESRSWRRKQAPKYRVEEVAKVFFGMSASWLRLKMSPDEKHPETYFTSEDGTRMEFRRSDPEKMSARVFWLSDIEPMAASLMRFRSISRIQYVRVLDVVQAQAALYQLFDDPSDEDGDEDGAGEGDGG